MVKSWSFRQSLKTLLLDNSNVLSASELPTTMCSINQRFTYLLPYGYIELG